MNYIGISNGYHDAGMSVVSGKGDILFAGHSERYSHKKNDSELNSGILADVMKYSSDEEEIHYYERPWLTSIRQFRAGQKVNFRSTRNRIGLPVFCHGKKITNHGHHLSHAAAGFQTSPFDKATVVIIDAIGELDTITIWDAWYDDAGYARYKKLWTNRYPNSIGLFYSAMTKRIGFKPMEEEYIMMGMAAYGDPVYFDDFVSKFISQPIADLTFKDNLHAGVSEDLFANAPVESIAASSQKLAEILIALTMQRARQLGKSSNLVYGGGVALNCVANRLLGGYFSNIWVPPNPGDCGSSLGAAALGYGKRLNWKDSFLGHDMGNRYPSNQILSELMTNQIVGVASGRAEFGPRALGNRSLLADPRHPDIKDRVNLIKNRQRFRPFAPMILEEHVHKYFTMPRNWDNSRYMQVVSVCNDKLSFPAITHIDGTSRVQTVPRDGSGVRDLLEKWYVMTECPMLLNTSLNVRGEPIVNNKDDANKFTKLYGVPVIT